MTTVNFTNPRARFFNRNGSPLAEGRVYFYIAGTNTLKEVYTTALGDVPAANPQPLDIEGFVVNDTGIHLGEGLYDIKVEEKTGVSTWAQYWTYPDIQGADVSGGTTAFSNINVGTIQNLRDLQGGTYGMAFVMGYYAINDGGARQMYWNSTSTKAENGGTVIVPQGNPAIGRWEWIPTNGDTQVTPQLFGGLPSDGSLVIASQIDSMINWCLSSQHKNIEFNLRGGYWLNSSSTFSGDLNVTIASGVEFKNAVGTASTDFTCESLIIKGRAPVVAPAPVGNSMDLVIRTVQPMNVLPEWWGVVPVTTSDSSWTLDRMQESIADNMVVEFSGEYSADATSIDYTNNTLQFNQGAFLECNGSDITLGIIDSKSNETIFRGSGLGFVRFTENFAKTEWLDWTTGDPSYNIKPFLNEFITLNTVSGTIQFDFEVNEGVALLDYSINEFFRANDYHLSFNWTFTEGSNFTCFTDGYIEFGYVNAGNYKVFEPLSSNDFKMRFINDVKLPWFGGTGKLDTATNANAIRSAYSQIVSSNASTNQSYRQRVSLDLVGGGYKTGAIVVPYVSGFSDAIVPIKNGLIWSEDAASILLDLGHGIEGSNLTLESRGLSTDLLFVDNSAVKFDRCSLKAKRAIIDSTSTDKLVITDCDLYVDEANGTTINMIIHAGDNSVIKDCTLRRIQTDTTGATQISFTGINSKIKDNECDGITFITKGAGIISDNNMTKGSIAVTDPSNMRIVGNAIRTSDFMDAKIIFSSTETAYEIEGVYCVGNTFVNGCSDPTNRADYICIDESFSGGTGIHSYADVYDNFIGTNLDAFRYLYAGTTRFEVEVGHVVGFPDWTAGRANLRMNFAKSELTSTQRMFSIFNDYELHNVNLSAKSSDGSITDDFTGFEWWGTRRNAAPPIVDLDFSIDPNTLNGDLYLTFETTNLQRPFIAKTIVNPLFP